MQLSVHHICSRTYWIQISWDQRYVLPEVASDSYSVDVKYIWRRAIAEFSGTLWMVLNVLSSTWCSMPCKPTRALWHCDISLKISALTLPKWTKKWINKHGTRKNKQLVFKIHKAHLLVIEVYADSLLACEMHVIMHLRRQTNCLHWLSSVLKEETYVCHERHAILQTKFGLHLTASKLQKWSFSCCCSSSICTKVHISFSLLLWGLLPENEMNSVTLL